MSSKPKTPDPVMVANRPERIVDVQPEDVQLGDGTDSTNADQGKRQLVRPKSVANTGLAV